MKCLQTTASAAVSAAMGFALAGAAAAQELEFAGALEFSDEGTLFVGDNHQGAIYAFDMSEATAPEQVVPVYIGDIDVRLADVLGIPSSALAINDMAVHPISADIMISVSRIANFESAPAIIRITQSPAITDSFAPPHR